MDSVMSKQVERREKGRRLEGEEIGRERRSEGGGVKGER